MGSELKTMYMNSKMDNLPIEGKLLFSILSDFLFQKKTEYTEISSDLIQLSERHQVTPILYYQTKNKSCRNSYLYAISNYTQRKNNINEIKTHLSQFQFCIIKGLSVSKYYPMPQLRTMGDCDIVVHESDKKAAGEILEAIGYKNITGECAFMEWHYEKNQMDFELHHRLLYDEPVNTELEKEFCDTSWKYVIDSELDPSFHFVYLIIHLKKHLMNNGVGIRQFFDLAILSKYADLNGNRIKDFLLQVKLEKFAGICASLCHRWFGVILPVDEISITDEFYLYATKTILDDGVFGFDAPKNGVRSTLNSINSRGRVQVLMDFLFPSYRVYSQTLKYGWIKGKPFLLPFMYIYRLFDVVNNHKVLYSVKHVNEIVSSSKALNEMNELFELWGL